MPRHVIQSFSYVSMYIVDGNHRSHIVSRFSIYRSIKILPQIIFVNKEKGILRNFLKIVWQRCLQCDPLLCHRMDEIQF